MLKNRPDHRKPPHSLIEMALSGTGNLELNRSIRSKMRYLEEAHGLDRDYLENWLYERFLANGTDEKYDPERSSVATFIGHCTNNALTDLIRRYNAMEKQCREVPLDLSGNDTSAPKRFGYSLPDLERAGVEYVIDQNTPEDYCLAKELMDLMVRFFEPEELKILLGLKDRATESVESGIGYECLCKRLQRKREAFRAVLKEAGYL